MNKIKWVPTLVALLICSPLSAGFVDEPKKIDALMKRKLEQSQLVLAGIAMNDFDKVSKSAQELIEISKAVEWKILKTPEYTMHSNDFRRSAENLIQASKAKNIDSAVLAYVEMTLTCVKCHKHVREVRMTRFDGREMMP